MIFNDFPPSLNLSLNACLFVSLLLGLFFLLGVRGIHGSGFSQATFTQTAVDSIS
jgi:hypothetical protein